MDEVLAFLQEARTFYVATVDGDKPRVRPFGFVMKYDGKMYFCTGNHKLFVKQMKENPYLEISACVKGDWLRLSAKGVFTDDLEAKKKAFEVSPGLAGIYQEYTNPDFAVFYIEDAQAEILSFVNKPRTYQF